MLNSPKTQTPSVISEWTVTGDPGQLLVPKGGTAQLAAPVLTETGFEWLSARAAGSAIVMLIAIAAAGFLLRSGTTWKTLVGFLIAAIVVLSALNLAVASAKNRRHNVAKLAYSATVVPTGETVTIQLGNVSARQAMVSTWGVITGLAGLGLLGFAAVRVRWGSGRRGWYRDCGGDVHLPCMGDLGSGGSFERGRNSQGC